MSSGGHERAAFRKFLNQAPKPSLTEVTIQAYEYIMPGCPVTRVSLAPHTGRTHQLRVHCAAALGYPIVGDDIYGLDGEGDGSGMAFLSNDCPLATQRQILDLDRPLALHAQKLCLFHPFSGAPMSFESEPYF